MTSRQIVAHKLLRLARALLQADVLSPYKSKHKSLKEHRPDIFRAIKGKVGIPGAGAERKYESYMTFSEGTSNKFHYFAVYETDDGEFIGANAYGRIGGTPNAVEIARGKKYEPVLAAVKRKEQVKRAKGYQPDKQASIKVARQRLTRFLA